jgi:hypothetical protein
VTVFTTPVVPVTEVDTLTSTVISTVSSTTVTTTTVTSAIPTETCSTFYASIPVSGNNLGFLVTYYYDTTVFNFANFGGNNPRGLGQPFFITPAGNLGMVGTSDILAARSDNTVTHETLSAATANGDTPLVCTASTGVLSCNASGRTAFYDVFTGSANIVHIGYNGYTINTLPGC